jgi:putative spermidine/putrescine transport system permease protein
VGLTVGRAFDDGLRIVGLLLMGLVGLFLVIPLVVTCIMAFDDRPYLGPLPPPGFSLRWFAQFFSDAYFLQGLGTSIELAAIAVSVSVVVGILTAIAVDRTPFGAKQALMSLFLSPLIVPPVVIGFALLLFLSALDLTNGFWRLLCGHIIITVPYTIRATLTGLSGIDRSLTEAALALGATERHALWDVTLPLARTGIISGAIFAFAVSMDDVSVSIMLTDSHTYTLPVALVSSMRANFDLSLAAASVMLTVITIVLILALDRLVGVNRVVGQGMFR